jgi:hypothetical protein
MKHAGLVASDSALRHNREEGHSCEDGFDHRAHLRRTERQRQMEPLGSHGAPGFYRFNWQGWHVARTVARLNPGWSARAARQRSATGRRV